MHEIREERGLLAQKKQGASLAAPRPVREWPGKPGHDGFV